MQNTLIDDLLILSFLQLRTTKNPATAMTKILGPGLSTTAKKINLKNNQRKKGKNNQRPIRVIKLI